MKNLNQKQTVANPVFRAVTEDKNVNLSLSQFYNEKPSTLNVVFYLTVLILTLPIITVLLLIILKMN